jgi:hypothetical protein
MTSTWRLIARLSGLALLFTCGLASAKDYQVGDLTVQVPWSQALPPNAPTVAAYFVISNHGTFPDRLVSVDTPIAGSAELHQHVHQDGMMKMQALDSLQINPEEDAVFAPMNYHVMLLDLHDNAPRAEGEHFPLTLHFEKAGDVTVEVEISRTAPKR